ncbi:MAG: hypothetical protein AB1726_06820, partial [Planctomycetota bacterium]
MIGGERRPAPSSWRIAAAIVLATASTVLVGDLVRILLPLLPPARLGALGPGEAPRIAGHASVAWALAHALGGAWVLAGAPGREAAARRE